MKLVAGTVAVLFLTVLSNFANAHFTLVKMPGSAGDLRSLLQEHELKAGKLHEKLYVELMADWCVHCHALNASLDNEKMQEAFQGTYIVQVDEDKWKDQLGSIGINPVGIPAFYQIDKNGLTTGYSINGGAWDEDTVANMAPPLKKYFLDAK